MVYVYGRAQFVKQIEESAPSAIISMKVFITSIMRIAQSLYKAIK